MSSSDREQKYINYSSELSAGEGIEATAAREEIQWGCFWGYSSCRISSVTTKGDLP